MLPNTEAEEQNGWRQEGARYVSTKRSTSSAASRGGLRGVDPRSIAVAGVLILSAALSLLLAGCTDEPRRLVMDDFESRELADWRTVSGGAGGWFVYTDGQKAPDPAHSDPNVPFDLPNPPQGTHAAVTDMNGPGTRILYRDVTLDGRLRLHMRVFYAGGDFSSPDTLAYDAPEANQQFRIDLVRRSAPIDSVAKGDVLVNVFQTSAGDPGRREPTPVSVDVSRWAGQTVRLRLAGVDNRGPLRAGVDDIRFAPIDSGADAGIELPDTPVASRALNLVLHRLTEADALTALSDRAAELAREGEFSGALLVARDGKDLLRKAWGLENREVGTREHSRHEVPHRVDEQDVHRGGDAAARRGGQARAGRHRREASPGVSKRGCCLEGHRAAPAHAYRRHRRRLRSGVRPEPPEAAGSTVTT